jgi:hypothetical protein
VKNIEVFISRVQKRLNQAVTVRGIVYSLNFALAGMAVIALIYIFQGFRVNLAWYTLPLAAGVLYWCIFFLIRRYSVRRAALFADKFYRLRDSLASQQDFNAADGGFHQLRREYTSRICSDADLKKIKIKVSRRALLFVAILFPLVVILSLLDDSSRVKDARQKAELVEKESKALSEELKKKFEELKKKMTPEQKKLLKKSGLEEEIRKLEAKRDLKAALRQYAELEKRISRAGNRSSLDEKERMFRQMARELMKNPITRKFGSMLKSGDYRKAAEELMKQQISDSNSNSKDAQQKLSRMQKMAEQMMEAARKANAQNSSMGKKMEQLRKAAQKARQSRKRCSSGQCSKKEYTQDLDEMNSELEKMADEMNSMDNAKEFMKKLDKMRKACGQCQNELGSSCQGGQKPGSGQGNGNKSGQGKGIGSGADGRLKQQPPEPDGGFDTALRGQKNAGPSRVKVEEAAAGSGLKRRQGKPVSGKFKRQMESFIKRDDIPSGMKKGVKKYFTEIHKAERNGQ